MKVLEIVIIAVIAWSLCAAVETVIKNPNGTFKVIDTTTLTNSTSIAKEIGVLKDLRTEQAEEKAQCVRRASFLGKQINQEINRIQVMNAL